MLWKNLLTLFVVLAVVSGFSVQLNSAAAQNPRSIESCDVNVRIVNGTGQAQGRHPDCSQVRDLEPQLKALPYAKYEVIDTANQQVSMNQQGEFNLHGVGSEKHRLTVLPHKIQGEKVQVTFHWRGAGNEELLSTRLRVPNNQNVVLGTESSSNASTILCVRLNCR